MSSSPLNYRVSPSLLSCDFSKLREESEEVIGLGADFLHLDVMDGHFVDNLTFGPCVIQSLKKSLPEAEFCVHLMVEQPRKWIESIAAAGGDHFIFHYENFTSIEEIESTCRKIRQQKMKPGISINPDKDLSLLYPIVKACLVDSVVIMTVHPGAGGQKFIFERLPHIERLRHEFPRLDIIVDGGINDETVSLAKKAGANIFVAGSYIFGNSDRATPINTLLEALRM